jgi:hypothetical protein
MHRFEDAMQKMQGMGGPERLKMIETLRGMCICPACPTYTGCMREKRERLFCVLAPSVCTVTKRNGCLCPTCPVTPKLGLSMLYYCADGPEDERRKKK